VRGKRKGSGRAAATSLPNMNDCWQDGQVTRKLTFAATGLVLRSTLDFAYSCVTVLASVVGVRRTSEEGRAKLE